MFLAETLQSLADQTFKDFEVLACDDGLDEPTRKILGVFSASLKITVVANGGHRGVGHSYLRFLETASGKYLAQIGHDDVWTPRFLETMVDRLENAAEVAAFSKTRIIDADSKFIDLNLFDAKNLAHLSGPSLVARLFENNFLCAASSLVRATELKAFRFPGEIDQLQDWMSWLFLALRSAFVYVPEVEVYYRVHSQNLSLDARLPLQLINEMALCRATLVSQVGFAALVESAGDAFLSAVLTSYSDRHSDERSQMLLEFALRANALQLDRHRSYRRFMARLLMAQGEISNAKKYGFFEEARTATKRVVFFLFGWPVGAPVGHDFFHLSLGPLTVLSLRFPSPGSRQRVYFAASTRSENAARAIERVLARKKLGISIWSLLASKVNPVKGNTTVEDWNMGNN